MTYILYCNIKFTDFSFHPVLVAHQSGVSVIEATIEIRIKIPCGGWD
jgi:hypothetical protein